MVKEADASRASGPCVGELDVRWRIGFQRDRLCVGDDLLAVAQQQTAAVLTLEREGSSSGGGDRSETCAAPLISRASRPHV